MLPDDVVLEIFDFYVNKDKDKYYKNEIEAWQTLVHVCRRWRSVVFGSSRRLNLRLVCTSDTPARDTLDIWPFLPLLIGAGCRKTESVDDVIAALERSDRVVEIELSRVNGSNLEIVLAAMQVPFPGLTDLQLTSEDGNLGLVSVLPDSFLGGSARRLQSISGFTETSFVCHSPRRSSPREYSSFRIHFTQGDRRCPLHLDQPQKSFPWIRIPSISP